MIRILNLKVKIEWNFHSDGILFWENSLVNSEAIKFGFLEN